MTSEAVRRVQSGSPWEESFGFARAVAAGDRVLVGGTTSFKGSVLYGEGDPYEQAKVAFTSALEAIAEFGLGPESVIRTRIFLTHQRDVDEVGRAHNDDRCRVRNDNAMSVLAMMLRLSHSLFMQWRGYQRRPDHVTTTDFQSALSEDHHRPALCLALSKYPHLNRLS